MFKNIKEIKVKELDLQQCLIALSQITDLPTTQKIPQLKEVIRLQKWKDSNFINKVQDSLVKIFNEKEMIEANS